jgi:hypothetical protein
VLRIPIKQVTRQAPNSDPGLLSYAQALESPCAACATSPCCSHVPIHMFQMNTMLDLDNAFYLLNFDNIELGIRSSGSWTVHYRYPCRFLSPDDFSCTVHGTAKQPNVCVHYNPYNCWYKRSLTTNVSEDFLRIDRARLTFIAEHLTFDDQRNIADVPSWETMTGGFARLPIVPTSQFGRPPPASDAALTAWEGQILDRPGADPTPPETHRYQSEPLQHPCDGCQAHCCKTLLFPRDLPTRTTDVDYLQFLLGFPGIELGIADKAWFVVVKTTCRHLVDNRCSIYGKPERPLRCGYYDAWDCTYKSRFGNPRPRDFLRLKLEQFPWLAECFEFDGDGEIVRFPTLAVIRQHVEDRWRGQARDGWIEVNGAG